MGSKLIVKNIIFLSFLLVILNLFDFWSLVCDFLNINKNIFQIFIVITIGSIYYNYSKKLDTFQIKIFMFFIFYFLFHLLYSFLFEINFKYSMSVFLMLILSLYAALSLRNYSNIKLYLMLFKVTKYTIVFTVLLSVVSQFMGGTKFIFFVILQNNTPILLLSLVALYFYSYNCKQKKDILFLFYGLLITMVLFYTFSGESEFIRFQFKAIILAGLIVIFSYLIIKIKFLVPFVNSKISLRYGVFITLLFTIFVFYVLSAYIYELILEFIPREGSGLTRIELAQIMFKETTNSSFTTLFGQGLGSGYKTFLLNSGREFKAHSGLMILFYEQGLFGLLIFMLVGFSFFIRKRIYIYQLKYKRGHAFFFLLLLSFLWIIQNMIYIIGFPSAVVFHQSQIFTYILLATFLSNKLFIPEEKIK